MLLFQEEAHNTNRYRETEETEEIAKRILDNSRAIRQSLVYIYIHMRVHKKQLNAHTTAQ